MKTAAYSGGICFVVGLASGVGLTRLNWDDGSMGFANRALSALDQNESLAGPGGRPSLDEQFDLSDLRVERDEMLRGGPPKDGIPALTAPETSAIEDVDFLRDDDRLVAVEMGGEARAYPIRMLNWHEIVNDELGGVPIAVVYCPLCDSVSVVDRRIEDETLTFGVSGLLYQSNVLMYDRQHDGLWSQILLEAISGPYSEQSLKHYGWEITTFAEWRERHRDGDVVTFNTGHRRDYARNPYEEYFKGEGLMFPVKREDDRLPKKSRVVGVGINDTFRAYPLSAIHEADGGRLEDELTGGRIVIEADRETGRVAVREAPEEARVIHTFWFTWAAVHPDTDVFGQQ